MLWWMLTAWQLSFIDRVNVGAAKLVGASVLFRTSFETCKLTRP